VKIIVYGTPAPQGSKRHVGNGVMVESSKKVKPWRQDVKYAALAARFLRHQSVDNPVLLRVVFTLPKPASAPKRRKTYPSKKPDIDKLLRSTMDGLTEAGVWVDDARVIEVTALKVFPNEHDESLDAPGARITITECMT